VAIADFFKLNEASFMGWIGQRDGTWIATAPYDAFRMVAREMEPELLAGSVNGASYQSPSVGAVDGVPSVPYLDLLATASRDNGSVTALLINKHLAAGIDANVELTGVAAAARVQTETLTGPSPDANTGTELPSIGGLHWAQQKGFGRQGRLDRGGPGEVRLERSELPHPSPQVRVRVPPHSLVLLRFAGVRWR
jgi:alpha-L-arabinofuranosidase